MASNQGVVKYVTPCKNITRQISTPTDPSSPDGDIGAVCFRPVSLLVPDVVRLELALETGVDVVSPSLCCVLSTPPAEGEDLTMASARRRFSLFSMFTRISKPTASRNCSVLVGREQR